MGSRLFSCESLRFAQAVNNHTCRAELALTRDKPIKNGVASARTKSDEIRPREQTSVTQFEPARALAAETLTLERTLSDLVNQAYGLTPADIEIKWQTAPPRMPIPPPVM